MSTVAVVFRKEMTDNLRDRRSIAMAMIYPIIGPLLLGLMITFVAGTLAIEPNRPIDIAVANVGNAPELVRFLKARGATMREAPADPAAAVRRGDLPLVLVLPERIAGAEGMTLEVRLVADAARLASIIPLGQVLDLLRTYESEVTTERLRAAGVSPDVATPLRIVHENVGRAISLGATFLSMMPPFLIFTLFLGGVYLTLDTTSGERERGSFEPLMINPVTRSEILLGKLAAAVVFTLIALAVQMVAFWVMLRLVPRESLGLASPPGALRLALLLPVCLPLALFAVATQLVIAAVTRSLREAQTYLGLLPLVPAIAGMILVFVPVHLQSLLAAIPTFGQTVLMGQVIRSEQVSWTLIGVSAVATLAVTFALLALAFRLYERERSLFPN